MRINNINQKISVIRSTINSGKGDGCKIITIENGVLSIILDESHGLDIFSLRYKGKLISLLTANGLVRDSTHFSKDFPGGMLYTCGLDTIGTKEGHRPHGEYHTIPADVFFIDHREEEVIIKAKIYLTRLFTPSLTVERTIIIPYLSNEFMLKDRIINTSSSDQPIVMLYHFNLGFPFIGGDTVIATDSTIIEPVTPFAEQRIDSCLSMGEGLEDEEQVFYHLDASNEIKVISKTERLVFTLQYDNNQFPILTEWKCLVDGHIALGIEPSMSKMYDQLSPRIIKKGEIQEYIFSLKVQET